jgi:hypothetical protein
VLVEVLDDVAMSPKGERRYLFPMASRFVVLETQLLFFKPILASTFIGVLASFLDLLLGIFGQQLRTSDREDGLISSEGI